jgi:hypothetical protein
MNARSIAAIRRDAFSGDWNKYAVLIMLFSSAVGITATLSAPSRVTTTGLRVNSASS